MRIMNSMVRLNTVGGNFGISKPTSAMPKMPKLEADCFQGSRTPKGMTLQEAQEEDERVLDAAIKIIDGIPEGMKNALKCAGQKGGHPTDIIKTMEDGLLAAYQINPETKIWKPGVLCEKFTPDEIKSLSLNGVACLAAWLGTEGVERTKSDDETLDYIRSQIVEETL